MPRRRWTLSPPGSAPALVRTAARGAAPPALMNASSAPAGAVAPLLPMPQPTCLPAPAGPYFFGDRPTSIDALLFAVLSFLKAAPVAHPDLRWVWGVWVARPGQAVEQGCACAELPGGWSRGAPRPAVGCREQGAWLASCSAAETRQAAAEPAVHACGRMAQTAPRGLGRDKVGRHRWLSCTPAGSARHRSPTLCLVPRLSGTRWSATARLTTTCRAWPPPTSAPPCPGVAARGEEEEEEAPARRPEPHRCHCCRCHRIPRPLHLILATHRHVSTHRRAQAGWRRHKARGRGSPRLLLLRSGRAPSSTLRSRPAPHCSAEEAPGVEWSSFSESGGESTAQAVEPWVMGLQLSCRS